MTGFINVDKREGASSAKEVSIIKRLTGCACGHMGTLDPLATGVLPVAIGNACRLFDYFLTKSKTYIATFLFGTDSDTLDITGNVTRTGGYVPAENEIKSVLNRFTGDIMQIPPAYSAKCVNGRRGYRLAREGAEFTLPPKKVSIHSIKLLGQADENSYKFEIECGGGTYIRSLARDIGATLGTCAVMSALRRTKSGVFTADNAVKTENLTSDNISGFIIPTDSVISLDSIHIDDDRQTKLLNGVAVSMDRIDGTYKLYLSDGSFYGLGEVKQSTLKVRTKLC